MVSLTDFISLSVDSVTLSYHSWSLVLAESFVRLLSLNMSQRNRVPKEGQRSPSGAKVGYFLKKKCFL